MLCGLIEVQTGNTCVYVCIYIYSDRNLKNPCSLQSSRGFHSIISAYIYIAAFPTIPLPEAINHIPVVTTSARQGPDIERFSHTSGNQPPTSLMPGNSKRAATISTPSFGAGLPPVPQKLVERIQEGEFIDMAELTIDRLSMSPFNDTSKPNHSKRWLVTSIIEWTQCFTNYIAILVQAHPERVSDLLGYQHLILQAHLEYLEMDG